MHQRLLIPESAVPKKEEVLEAAALFIAKYEQATGSYNSRPHWPGPDSGITIGYGYDLRFVRSYSQLRSDWPQLSAVTLERLTAQIGVRGTSGAVAKLADITIPQSMAWETFVGKKLPAQLLLTNEAFPGVARLPAPPQVALLDLVYNRGSGIGNRQKAADWSRRAEMRGIRQAVREGDLGFIAYLLLQMKRIWTDDKKSRGLLSRREDEAEKVLEAVPGLTLAEIAEDRLYQAQWLLLFAR